MARKISRERIGQILKAILIEIKNVGGEARVRDIFPIVELKLNLNEYELETLERSGHKRWRIRARFNSVMCTKAGYITKSGGKWKLTSLGEKAIKNSDSEFTLGGLAAYRAWDKSRKQEGTGIDNQPDEE